MTLNDFMTSVLSEAETEKNFKLNITEITQAANRIYRANFVSPAHIVVRFDSSIVQLEHSRASHVNLLVRILPDHPYFRPWFKQWALRSTEPLYLINLYSQDTRISLCGQPQDAEIRSIVDTVEQRIIERTIHFEQCLHTLNTMTDRYILRYDDISAFLNALDDAAKLSQYDRDFFLRKENRTALLPD